MGVGGNWEGGLDNSPLFVLLSRARFEASLIFLTLDNWTNEVEEAEEGRDAILQCENSHRDFLLSRVEKATMIFSTEPVNDFLLQKINPSSTTYDRTSSFITRWCHFSITSNKNKWEAALFSQHNLSSNQSSPDLIPFFPRSPTAPTARCYS